MPPLPPSSNGLYGLVDMGSNGIRLSITNLSGLTARSLPTVYQDRIGLSLYDAQFSSGNSSTIATTTTTTAKKGPIPQDVIDEVIAGLKKFKAVCGDFGVEEGCVKVLATEATRTAVNSVDYRKQIKEATGWEVDMLTKEMEGRIGAMGVASSFNRVEGLVMDLGGGSTQITYLTTLSPIHPNDPPRIETSPQGSISFPYGAAALTQRLSTLDSSSNPTAARQALATQIQSEFRSAYAALTLPPHLLYKAAHGGLTLYLSGGGFRGWGFLHLSRHKVSPYPIPIINGFSISKLAWSQTTDVEELAALSLSAEQGEGVFRISKRRAAQVPAVAFLVNCLIAALPFVQDVRFCQGGVREGWWFDSLNDRVKAGDPLVAATSQFTQEHQQLQSPDFFNATSYGFTAPPIQPPSQPLPLLNRNNSQHTPARPTQPTMIGNLLYSALPTRNDDLDRSHPGTFTRELCTAIANCMYLGSAHPKETRSLNALMLPITGALAGAHGVGHAERAILALVLRRRWGDDMLPPPWDNVAERLRMILTPQEAWWCEYLGCWAEIVGSVYPNNGATVLNSTSASTSTSQPEEGGGAGGAGESQVPTSPISPLESNPATPRIKATAKWTEGLGKKGLSQGVKVRLQIKDGDAMMGTKDSFNSLVDAWEKVGKRKNWTGGFGVPVRVAVERC